LEVACHTLHLPVHGLGVEPRPNGDAKSGAIPPGRMETRVRSNDCAALLARRRQRPLRWDGVRFGEVLKEEMPRVRLCITMSLETTGHDVSRHHRRDPIIECNLLTASV
jgi:hypothetical protein